MWGKENQRLWLCMDFEPLDLCILLPDSPFLWSSSENSREREREREREAGKGAFWFVDSNGCLNTNLYAFILFMKLPDIFVTVNLFWKRYYSAVNVTKSSPKTNCKFAIQFFLFLPIFLTLYYFWMLFLLWNYY